ncbi:MAG: FHA domain-containing protein [Verrucomicrobia bacterium]|nr:FHA domain-containing protein [Verrucomicrobiota bacterium]
MLQLTLLGRVPAETTPVRGYPFRVGRAPGDQLRLQAPGVWDSHCTFEWRGTDGIHLVGNPQALTALNGQPVKQARIRNGDLLEIGGARLLVSVAPAAQRSFRLLEILIWLGLAGTGLAQLFLMLWGLP